METNLRVGWFWVPNTFPKPYLNSKPISLVVRSKGPSLKDTIYMVPRPLQKLDGASNTSPYVHILQGIGGVPCLLVDGSHWSCLDHVTICLRSNDAADHSLSLQTAPTDDAQKSSVSWSSLNAPMGTWRTRNQEPNKEHRWGPDQRPSEG